MEKFIKLLNFRKALGALTKKQFLFAGVALAVVGGIAYSTLVGGDKIVTVEAKIGDIEEEVLATGKTKSKSEVKLAFERNGKIASVGAEVGDKVSSGETLAVLDQADLKAGLLKAEANLNKALVELKTTERTSALSYENAFDALLVSIRDAYNAADDAIRNNTDQFFINPRSYNAVFDPSFEDGGTTFLGSIPHSVKSEISSERVEIENLLVSWEVNLSTPKNDAEIEAAFSLAQSNLLKVRSFLDKISSAINSLKSTDFAYNTTIQGYKTTASAARSSVSASLTSLLSAKDRFNRAPKATASFANYDEVLKQEAVVESLRADVAAIRADLAKTVLKAPISGTVTRFDAEVGEIVTSGSTLISIISEDKLQIETNISEVNIGKIKVDNEAVISFDAFPNKVYFGKVVYIDPGETLVDKVPTYKVTIAFADSVPQEILSGLTANLRISTNKKTGVLVIPSYATRREGDKVFVTVISSGKEEEREIEAGLRGSNGMIEVISGLEAGDTLSVKK